MTNALYSAQSRKAWGNLDRTRVFVGLLSGVSDADDHQCQTVWRLKLTHVVKQRHLCKRVQTVGRNSQTFPPRSCEVSSYGTRHKVVRLYHMSLPEKDLKADWGFQMFEPLYKYKETCNIEDYRRSDQPKKLRNIRWNSQSILPFTMGECPSDVPRRSDVSSPWCLEQPASWVPPKTLNRKNGCCFWRERVWSNICTAKIRTKVTVLKWKKF